MSGKAPAVLLALATALVLFASVAPLAAADTGNVIEPQHEPPSAADGWQATTCKTDTPKCTPESPYSQFFTQAGGHPPIGFTQYIIRHSTIAPDVVEPIEEPIAGRSIRTLRVDLPPGFTVNPEAAPRCPLADFERVIGGAHLPNCPESTIVGREEVTLVVNTPEAVPNPAPPPSFLPVGFVIQPTYELPGTPSGLGLGTRPPVYNLEPKAGEPALFGFVVAGEEVVFLETDVAWESDFHEAFTIRLSPPSPPFSTLTSRLLSFGQDAGNLEIEPGGEFKVNPAGPGNGTYLNTPTTCYSPLAWPHLYSTWYRAESYEEPDSEFPNGSTAFEAKAEEDEGNPIPLEGCAAVPFEPGVKVEPGTTAVDSPSGATIDTTLKYYTGAEGEVQASHLKHAEMTLPEGMALNPSGANGLAACTDAQFKKGVRTYDNECPAGSKIGTVEIETPPLPPGTLKGDVYVGQQKSSDPASGEMFRILVEAKSEERGVDVRLVGNVKADPATGRLTAAFGEQEVGPLAGKLPEGLPQAPFTSVKLHLDGSKAVLTSPPTCSAAQTSGEMEPWARPGTTTPVSSSFTLTTAPDGGTCPKTLGERPFDPGYNAGPPLWRAGAKSPFELHLTRPDGAQEIRRVDVKLPPGMVAKLRGLEYCPEASIQAAEAEAGTAVIASPVCPDKSWVGTAVAKVGSGSNPYTVTGNVYLAGPYEEAPVSLVFVTPAVAGPYDLGTVVVRTALNVDPETTRVTAVSDPIPYVFGGVKLDIRSIDVSISRTGFTRNPTTCREPFSIVGQIFGGGANPADPAAWVASRQQSRFWANHCRALEFKPKFYARIFAGRHQTHRGAHPKFRAILEARYGDANVRRVAFLMPHAEFLDQSHIRTICTRTQLERHRCPKGSVYGYARAKSPLLNGILEGPVYLTSSKHKLPDLLADLRGQVNVRLRGVISSVNGRMKTVFEATPDVAVSKFILVMREGSRGLLVNSENLCTRTQLAHLYIKAQNSRRLKTNRLRLNIPACRS